MWHCANSAAERVSSSGATSASTRRSAAAASERMAVFVSLVLVFVFVFVFVLVLVLAAAVGFAAMSLDALLIGRAFQRRVFGRVRNQEKNKIDFCVFDFSKFYIYICSVFV